MVKTILSLIVFLPLSAFAQLWDFSTPEKLSANVNTEYEESFPLVTPDGKTMFFTRFLFPENRGGKFTGTDVYISSFDGEKGMWGKAVAAKDHFNNTGNNAVVGVSKDGQIVYLMNSTGNKKTHGLYFSKKVGSIWTRPELIPIEGIEPQSFLGFYVSPDFDVIIISMKATDSRGEEDLYISIKDKAGNWSKPKNLGTSINSKGYEISPFLSPDKTRLYFSSNGHKGFGDADIFYSDRLYNSWDTWSAPKNLGEKLNSKGFDAYFSIYGDTLAYFSSNRNGKYADLYKVKVYPGNESLPFGQRYVTSDEMGRYLGASVSRRVTFENGATQLTAPQKELLFFIANKLSQEREISIQAVMVEENNPTLTEARLNAVVNQLKESGFESIRLMTLPNSRNKKENQTKAVVELMLVK